MPIDKDAIIVSFMDQSGNTKVLDDWVDVRVTRSFGNLVGSAEITMQFNSHIAWNRLCGLRGFVTIGPYNSGTLHSSALLVGYITDVSRSFNAKGHTVTITMKDKTVDLIQCNPIHILEKSAGAEFQSFYAFEPTTYVTPALFPPKSSLPAIIRGMCEPLSIDVVDRGAKAKLFTGVATVETETVWSQIKKLCIKTGVFPYTSNAGQLVIDNMQYEYRSTRQGPWKGVDTFDEGTAIKERDDAYRPFADNRIGNVTEQAITVNKNDILSFHQMGNFDNRYSDYKTIYSTNEHGASWDEKGIGEGAVAASYSTDYRTTRYRPICIKADSVQYDGNPDEFTKWLMETQRGDSNHFTFSVRDWYKIYGDTIKSYNVGTVVKLDLPEWGLVIDTVVTKVMYELSGSSHRKLTITSKPAGAYLPMPADRSKVYDGWIDKKETVVELEKELAIGPENKKFGDRRDSNFR